MTPPLVAEEHQYTSYEILEHLTGVLGYTPLPLLVTPELGRRIVSQFMSLLECDRRKLVRYGTPRGKGLILEKFLSVHWDQVLPVVLNHFHQALDEPSYAKKRSFQAGIGVLFDRTTVSLQCMHSTSTGFMLTVERSGLDDIFVRHRVAQGVEPPSNEETYDMKVPGSAYTPSGGYFKRIAITQDTAEQIIYQCVMNWLPFKGFVGEYEVEPHSGNVSQNFEIMEDGTVILE